MNEDQAASEPREGVRIERALTGVALDQLVIETLNDFHRDTKEQNIIWEIRPLPAVQGDRALLRLVLAKLLSNAVNFIGKRTGAKIEVDCAPSSDGEVVIFVRGNDFSVDSGNAKKLFGVFRVRESCR